MHFQFLIEDQSGFILVEQIMQKMKEIYPEITSDYKYFHGIGGFTKKNTVKETKDGKLLNDLATYLAGFNKKLAYMDAAILVILDNDRNDPQTFRSELESIAIGKNITVDHVFCLAIEEMEAWLLGDENAIQRAYPNAKMSVLHSYVQDSICGTWEVLADVIYKGGSGKMKKENSSANIGKIKCEWAKNIGQYMNLRANRSPSFNLFIGEMESRLSMVQN